MCLELIAISLTYIGVHVKYPLFLADFNETFNFSAAFQKKNIQVTNFKKIRPAGAELFRADRQTDMTKLVVAFRNFANGPNKTDEFTIHTLFLLRLFKNLSHRKKNHKKFVDFNEFFA